MLTIARVAIASATYSIDKPYDYIIPPELEGNAKSGCRVLLPFGGGNKANEGMILSVYKAETTERVLKQIAKMLDKEPVLNAEAIKLALWLRERCFCTLYDVIKAMLPVGLYYKTRDSYSIMPGIDRETAYNAVGRSKLKKKVIDVLFANGGECPLETMLTAFDNKLPHSSIKELANSGIIMSETSVMRNAGDMTSEIISLVLSPEEALSYAASRHKTAPLQSEVMKTLAAVGEASAKELCYFTGASIVTVRSLIKKGLIESRRVETFRRPTIDSSEILDRPVLNDKQQEVYAGMKALMFSQKPEAALLYGVTGSGKTQVYISLIYDALSKNKTALMLVPEIALTPQFMRLFAAHFGDSVAILHSGLRTTERYDEWKRIKAGKARVVIGTRSAVFAPLENLGLIIIDEEHEQTYKSEASPRYSARDVAKFRCNYHNALMIMGSATPALESMYSALHGTYHLFRLDKRYNEMPLPEVIIADIKQEVRSGSFGSVGSVLEEEIRKNLESGEQTILFLNRRGSSRLICCEKCGYVPGCDRCSVKLSFHQMNGRLMCHYCGKSIPIPQTCPECGASFRLVGYGTQHLEQELQEKFPGMTLLRMDSDTVSASNTHDNILSKFKNDNIQVLIGTQMVTKGLDFENVTLVGVIDADTSLYSGNYRAYERTFSQITQVIGRAGRGTKKGRAVIQTMTPLNTVLNFAAVQDYDSFYENELTNRSIGSAPPYVDHIVLTFSGMNDKAVENSAKAAKSALETAAKEAGINAVMVGPAPAVISKVNGRYRWKITLITQNNKAIRSIIESFLTEYSNHKMNRGVIVFADVNPFD